MTTTRPPKAVGVRLYAPGAEAGALAVVADGTAGGSTGPIGAPRDLPVSAQSRDAQQSIFPTGATAGAPETALRERSHHQQCGGLGRVVG